MTRSASAPRLAAVILAVCSFLCGVKAQTASAPAPAPAVVSTYQRPITTDCVASTASSSLDYFPLQFQISDSFGPTSQEQINVRPGLALLKGHKNGSAIKCVFTSWHKSYESRRVNRA